MAVKFLAATFSLAPGATVNAQNRGWHWTETNDPRKRFTCKENGTHYALARGAATY